MRKLLIFMAPAFLGACSILPSPKSHPISQYELAPPSASTLTAGATHAVCPLVVRVRSVASSPPYATTDMLYMQSPHEISSYAWHRWVATPATMLTRDIAAAVTSSGGYRAVLGPTDPGDADLTLAVRLDEGPLQVFSATEKTDAPSRASTERLSFTAILTETAGGTVLSSRRFSASVAADPTPYGGVVAAGKLTDQLVGELVHWLNKLRAGAACPDK